MIKRFIPIFLGFSLMFGLGVNSNINNIHKEVIETKAASGITSEEEKGLVVLSESNFDANAEYVLKSSDGYYYNGTGGTSSSKWGGITKTIGEVARLSITGDYTNGFKIFDINAKTYLKSTTGNMTWSSKESDGAKFKMGTSSTFSITYTVSNNKNCGIKVNSTSGIRLYDNLTYNETSGKPVALYKIPELSTDPSVALSSDSSSTLDIFKGDTGNVKFLVKNIADVTKDSWSFTFSEGQDNISLEGSTLDTNNVGTVSITASTIGTSKFTVSVDGTSCETVITVNVIAKPASMTIESKTIKEGNILEIATGDSKTVSFSGKDTDGNDYAIKAADVTAEVTSGSSYISLSETTKIYGNKVGGGVVTFTLKALESVTAKLTVNVFDDYALSVKNISFADNLESEANENPVEAIFSERSATTYFGNTQDIPLSCFIFSYDEDGREDAKTMDEFIYDISKGSSQTIYVFCSLDLENVYSYSITIKDKPISGLLVDGKEVENESAIELDIERGKSKQLNVAVAPDSTTLSKEIEYSFFEEPTNGNVTLTSDGLVSIGNILGDTQAIVQATSIGDSSYVVYFYVNVVLEDMSITVKNEVTWSKATSISVGDEIIIYNESAKMQLSEVNSGNVGVAKSYTTNPVYSSNDAFILTVGKGNSDNTYTFSNGSNYLAYTSAETSKYNNLMIINSPSTTDEMKQISWTVSVSYGSFTIKNVYNDGRTLLYNPASNQERFVCYTSSSSGMSKVQIYKKTIVTSTITVGADLITAIEEFNSEENFQCDPSGVTFNSSAWANNNMFTEEIKTTYKLANVEANQNGNEVEQFLYNYDHVLTKKNNGIAAYQEAVDFLSRFSEGGINYVSSNSQSKIVKSVNDNNVLVIVTIVSVLGATSIGGYLFLRKRRYN